jgi:hypothetical protein
MIKFENEPRICIGVPTGEMARQAVFYDYLSDLITPENTRKSMCHGHSPARGRNLIIADALKNDCTHILFIDDDVAFRPQALMQLLAHNVDMVTGLYTMRTWPHQPIIFDRAFENGAVMHSFLNDGRSGLQKIVASGLGFCLINTKVFRGMEPPWITLGELEKDHWCDDIAFFRRANMAGFELYCDLECPIGHMATVILWPHRINGVWHTALDTSGRNVYSIPQVKNVEEANAINAGKPLWSDPWDGKDDLAHKRYSDQRLLVEK